MAISRPPLLQNKTLTNFLLFLLLLLSIVYSLQIYTSSTTFLRTDFGKFYQATHFAQRGKSIYSKIFLVRNHTPQNSTLPPLKQMAPDLNPPFFTFLTLPLGHLSYTHALWLWSALSIAGGVLSILLLQKSLWPQPPPLNITLALLGAFFVYLPTFTNIQFGQITLLLLPFEVGAWLAIRKQKTTTAGLLLGIAASLKPFFGLFLLYFLIRREWRGLCSFAATILICTLLPLTVFSLQNYSDYNNILHHVNWYASSWNASVLGFLIRLFGGESNTALIAIPGLAHRLFYIITPLIVASLIRFLWPSSTINSSQKTDLDFSIIIIAMLLLSPLAWLYYFSLLLIPVVVLLQLAKQRRTESLHFLACISIVLSGISHIFQASARITADNVLPLFAFSSGYLLALIILFGLLYRWRTILATKANLSQPPLETFPVVLTYSLALLPSLFGLLNIINSSTLFSGVFVPEFSSALFAN